LGTPFFHARGHVGDAVDVVVPIGVVFRVLGVPEDVVVLGGPPLGRPRTVVVRPDDLVYERLTPKDRIQEYLAVVHLPVVNVKKERAVRLEEPVGLF
jgi:hypothetical protein